jgi:hypothetical protein
MSQASLNLKEPLHLNWFGLLKPINQPINSKQPVQLTPQTISLEKTLEEILRDINIQVLETNYFINLGQLSKIVLDIKRYIFKLIKFVQLVQLELACAIMAIDH